MMTTHNDVVSRRHQPSLRYNIHGRAGSAAGRECNGRWKDDDGEVRWMGMVALRCYDGEQQESARARMEGELQLKVSSRGEI